MSDVMEKTTPQKSKPQVSSPSRRKFIGGVAAAAATAGAIGLTPAMDSSATKLEAATLPTAVGNRAPLNYVSPPSRLAGVYALRLYDATVDALKGVPTQTPNADSSYPDKGGVFTKCLVHDNYGRVDLVSSYPSYTKALASGKQSDFEAIVLGSGGRTLNDPQGGLRYQIEGLDTAQFASPAAPALSGPEFAVEMMEMYWASLLRDVEFNDYVNNTTAQAAAAELNANQYYNGPRNSSGQVTTNELFRAGFGRTPNYFPQGNSNYFPGATTGPYLSQFQTLPTYLGSQQITQQWQVFLPPGAGGADYMYTAPSTGGFVGTDWLAVQNGATPASLAQLQFDPTPRYPRNGRDLASNTHGDVPPQEAFVALLILLGMNAPVNPGSPYYTTKADNAFDTFGGVDASSVVGQVVSRALDVVWYQKWNVHLRIRPEVVGAYAHLALTGQNSYTDVVLDNSLLNSQAMSTSTSIYGSHLLSQAFPEGSPSHPDYPTGHGCWIGAAVTILKFFFDGSYVIPNPMMVGSGGQTLVPYTGSPLTVNGELDKLCYNVSSGHGLHAGIHFRSAIDQSILLGEAFALSVLQDIVNTYNERVTISLQKFDGTTATFTNNFGQPSQIG